MSPLCLTYSSLVTFSAFLCSLFSLVSSSSFSPFFTYRLLLSPSFPSSLLPPSSCGLRDPSWAEIRHFVMFLDIQLESCEVSVFCDETFVGDVMAGLKGFVVKFMIRMSRVRQCMKWLCMWPWVAAIAGLRCSNTSAHAMVLEVIKSCRWGKIWDIYCL